jgi:hypothetical protein
LWQTKLPAAAFATPATYEVNGKQYVVIACGGGKLGTKSGDSYVAFALSPSPKGSNYKNRFKALHLYDKLSVTKATAFI